MKGLLSIAVLAVSFPISSLALAAEAGIAWTGPSVSIQAGLSRIAVSGEPIDPATGATVGASAGYVYALTPSVVIGADVFYEWNPKQRHSQGEVCIPEIVCPKGHTEVGVDVYGADALVGFPVGADRAWMPYLKAGYVRAQATGHISGSDSAPRYGIGIEWRASSNYGFSLQYVRESFRFSETVPVYFGIVLPPYEDEVDNNSVTLGFNWHFN